MARLEAISKGLIKGAGRVGNWKTSRNHLNYSIVKIGQNLEKSLGDQRKLAVTQTRLKDHPLTLMRKNCQQSNNKAKIGKMQQNSKHSKHKFGDRYETVNHIIRKCSKQIEKEYKTRNESYQLGIVQEIEIQQNETHKQWDLKIQADNLIRTRRPSDRKKK